MEGYIESNTCSTNSLTGEQVVNLAKDFYDTRGPYVGTFVMALPVLGAFRNRGNSTQCEWSVKYKVEPDTGEDYFGRFFYKRRGCSPAFDVVNMHQCDAGERAPRARCAADIISGKCNKLCAVCGDRARGRGAFVTPSGKRWCSACHYKRSANEVCDFMNEHPECYKGHGRNIQGIVMTKALNDLKKSSPRLSPTLTHLAEEIYKKKTWFKFPIIEKDGRYEVGTISTDPTYKKGGKPVMFLTEEVAIQTIKNVLASNVLAKNRKHDLIHDLVLEDGTGKTKTYSLRFPPQVVTPTTHVSEWNVPMSMLTEMISGKCPTQPGSLVPRGIRIQVLEKTLTFTTKDDDLKEDTSSFDETDFEGVSYLEDESTGKIYNMKYENVGKWNEDVDDIIWQSENFKSTHETSRP
jgi:hypothetical protein